MESSDFDIAAIQDLGGFRMPKIYCFCGRGQFLNKMKFYLQEFGLASWIWVKMFLVFKGLQEKALALSGSVYGHPMAPPPVIKHQKSPVKGGLNA